MQNKTRSDKSLHIFDYNDVECISYAYFSLFPLVDILFPFLDSSHVCLLSSFSFFLSSRRENIFLHLYLKLFVHSLIPSLSDDLKFCYLRKFTFTRVVLHTSFYVFSTFKKCFFRLFSARYFCIEFKSYQKCQLRRLNFCFRKVRIFYSYSHMFLVDSVMERSFLLFNRELFLCLFLFSICVLDRHFDLVFRVEFSIYFNLLTSRFRMIDLLFVQVATIWEVEFKLAQSELYSSATKPLSVRHHFFDLTWRYILSDSVKMYAAASSIKFIIVFWAFNEMPRELSRR